MQAFKSRLRQRLAERGWEVVEVIDSEHWWADEFWRVASRRKAWGLEVVLTFEVDPQWDQPRKKGQGVWIAIATEQLPTRRHVAEPCVAELPVSGGRPDEELAAFVTALDDHRNSR